MNTKFNNLPVDCVQLIFNRLPNRTLIHIRQVCHHWSVQQQVACRTRKTLILFSGKSPMNLLLNSMFERNLITHQIDINGKSKNWKAYFDRNQLKLKQHYILTSEIVNFLVHNFPRVRTLIVAHHQNVVVSGSANPLVYLLQNYSQQLTKLKLYLKYRNQRNPRGVLLPPSDHVNQLYQSFDSLTSLKHLTLECIELQSAVEQFNFNLNFITRLKEFYCYIPLMTNVWFDSLAEFERAGRLDRLKKIGLNSHYPVTRPEFSIPISHWPVRSRFTHYPAIFLLNEPINLSSITRFLSLCSSYISPRFVPSWLTELSQKLSPLTKLVHMAFLFNEPWLDIPADQNDLKLEMKKSVKAIDLIFCEKIKLCQYYPSLRTLAAMLPNVESILFMDHRPKTYPWTRSYSQEECMEGNAIAFLNKLKSIYRRQIRTSYCALKSY